MQRPCCELSGVPHLRPNDNSAKLVTQRCATIDSATTCPKLIAHEPSTDVNNTDASSTEAPTRPPPQAYQSTVTMIRRFLRAPADAGPCPREAIRQAKQPPPVIADVNDRAGESEVTSWKHQLLETWGILYTVPQARDCTMDKHG